MTGTSLDAVDVAVASICGQGLEIQATLLRHSSLELGDLGSVLRRAADGEPMSAEAFCRLALDLGRRYAEAIAACLDPLGDPLDLIALHGQTIVHRPPLSWQLLNPGPIAERFECPLVCDLRQADLACGGQGAPITPLADLVIYGTHASRLERAVVNLGGFCNVTILPTNGRPDAITGFDVCACNHVLDAVARMSLGAPFDRDGSAASRGRPEPGAVAALCNLLEQQRGAGRSLGSGDEAGAWVREHAERLGGDDLAASACTAVARTIASSLDGHAIDEVVLAGGGTGNRALVAAIARNVAPVALRQSDDLGVPAQAREALAMAVLGALAADGIPVALPQVTGATRALAAGLWWLPPRGA